MNSALFLTHAHKLLVNSLEAESHPLRAEPLSLTLANPVLGRATSLECGYTACYPAALEADEMNVFFGTFCTYTCQVILCQLPASLPWKEKISLFWFHEGKLHGTSGELWHRHHSAFGKWTGVCTGVWGQARQQNLWPLRRGAGTWQPHGTRLFDSLNGPCCVKFAHKKYQIAMIHHSFGSV